MRPAQAQRFIAKSRVQVVQIGLLNNFKQYQIK